MTARQFIVGLLVKESARRARVAIAHARPGAARRLAVHVPSAAASFLEGLPSTHRLVVMLDAAAPTFTPRDFPCAESRVLIENYGLLNWECDFECFLGALCHLELQAALDAELPAVTAD